MALALAIAAPSFGTCTYSPRDSLVTIRVGLHGNPIITCYPRLILDSQIRKSRQGLVLNNKQKAEFYIPAPTATKLWAFMRHDMNLCGQSNEQNDSGRV